MMKNRYQIAIIALLMGALGPHHGGQAKGNAQASRGHQTGPVHHPNVMHLNKTEQSFGIPRGLLSAISKVESGRMTRDKRGLVPWPWALNVGGEGRFYSSKAEAITAAQTLLKKGVRNFDVGLMQVNLHHHPKAFTSLEQAFDPGHNVRYAAQFLTDLKRRHGSWEKAIAHYHSANPEHHVPYRKKVMDFWRLESQQGRSPYPLRWADAVFDTNHRSFRGRLVHRPWPGRPTVDGGYAPSRRYKIPATLRGDQDFLHIFRNKVRSTLQSGGKVQTRGFQYKRPPVPSWRTVGIRLNRGGGRKNP